MKSAVTISLVREAEGGPFVFWHDLKAGCETAARLGFDAVEIFAPGPNDFDASLLRELLAQHNLRVAAFGTGAGWVKHKLTLTSPAPAVRQRARDFAVQMMERAAEFKAPIIVGSMQGRIEPGVDREDVLDRLREALGELAVHAARQKQSIFFEPLNRYETNVINNVEQALELLAPVAAKNIKLLLDIFHLNIEEANIAASLRQAGAALGHVHFVDSNRRAVGWGHIDYAPIIRALRDIKYSGYLSAEIVPLPNSEAAAAQSIAAFKALVQ